MQVESIPPTPFYVAFPIIPFSWLEFDIMLLIIFATVVLNTDNTIWETI